MPPSKSERVWSLRVTYPLAPGLKTTSPRENRGHALMQNLRRGHYELGLDARAHRRVKTAFTELAHTI
jgi:hypothetical protein